MVAALWELQGNPHVLSKCYKKIIQINFVVCIQRTIMPDDKGEAFL